MNTQVNAAPDESMLDVEFVALRRSSQTAN